jgi:hypothetical protein
MGQYFRNIFVISIICLSSHFIVSWGQESVYYQSILELLEIEDLDESDWLEHLWELRQKPLNLNQASLEELLQIPFLSPYQATKIIEYRNKKGELVSFAELSNVRGMNQELIDALEPFIITHQSKRFNNFIYRFQGRLEYPQREGYLRDIYHSPVYLQHRLLFELGKSLSGGIVWEKDAGEDNYFDYVSYYLLYKNPDRKFSILVGDYQIRVGSGLMLWSPFGMPLSTESLPVLPRTLSSLAGHKSSQESGYFHGISLAYKFTTYNQIQFYLSRANFDANLKVDEGIINSIYTSGLHRTSTEKLKKDILAESLLGCTVQNQFKTFNLNVSTIYQRHSVPIQNQDPDQYFVSLSYILNLNKLKPAGDIALLNGKFPALHQFLVFSSDYFSYEVIGYYYHPRYFALYGRSIGSVNTNPSNRIGTASLGRYKVSQSTTLSGYVHLHRKVTDRQSNISIYRDYFLAISYRLKGQKIRIQYRNKYRENEGSISSDLDSKIEAVRLDHRISLNNQVYCLNRIELRWMKPIIEGDKKYSISLIQEIKCQFTTNMKVILRWTTFDIPAFNLRIYEYEPDLPGSFRSILLNNRGYKWFMLINLKVFERLETVLKYQERFYPELNEIGSGLDVIKTQRVRDFRLSIILKK